VRVLPFGLVIALVAACGSEVPAPAPSACEGVELLVAASDYTSSMVCGAPRCERSPRTSGVDLGSDPQLTVSSGRAFFLARDVSTIFEIDPTCGTPKARFAVTASTGERGNPHDVAVAPDGALFVPLWDRPSVVIVRDGRIAETIDLSPFDDDGNPQAEAIRIVDVGGAAKAFVALERLDDSSKPKFLSTRPSQMLRIDVATRKVEGTIELAGRNPFNTMAEKDGVLFMAEPGNFDIAGEPFAGIERFDTKTSETRMLVSEEALGGSVTQVAVTDHCGVAIVAGPVRDVNPTSLVSFDPDTGRVIASAALPLFGPTAGFDLQGLTWRGDTLYLGDRRAAGTGYPVHVFEREPGTCNLHLSPRVLDLPLAPVALGSAR